VLARVVKVALVTMTVWFGLISGAAPDAAKSASRCWPQYVAFLVLA
jgi:hypothetical protein